MLSIFITLFLWLNLNVLQANTVSTRVRDSANNKVLDNKINPKSQTKSQVPNPNNNRMKIQTVGKLTRDRRRQRPRRRRTSK